jgi:hypothetical protein
VASAEEMIPSFDQKPANGGMPTSASVPTRKATCVRGSTFLRPPIFRMSCSSSRWWMTTPADMNSSALKKACVMRWKIAYPYAPRPAARNM